MNCFRPQWLHSEQTFVPCGTCNFCLQARRMDWAFRLQIEKKNSISSHFITLTYADEYLPINTALNKATLDKTDLQKFIKRLRKANEKYRAKNARRIRYYAVGEYGTETERPHYHIILFNAQRKTIERLENTWKIGQIHKGRVTPASIGYVAGYTINRFETYGKLAKPFAVMSRGGRYGKGIGFDYVNANKNYHKTAEQSEHKWYIVDDGIKRRLPRYFANKIFNGFDKEYHKNELEPILYQEKQSELERLKKFHDDPQSYYEQCRTYKHELIFKNSKKQHTL